MVVFAVSLVIATPGLILLVLAGLELLALVLFLPIIALARVAFGRHWHVEVRRGFTSWHEEPAGRWPATRERIAELAGSIEQGHLPPPTLMNESSPEPS